MGEEVRTGDHRRRRRGTVAPIAGSVDLPPDAELAGTAAECAEVMANLEKAARRWRNVNWDLWRSTMGRRRPRRQIRSPGSQALPTDGSSVLRNGGEIGRAKIRSENTREPLDTHAYTALAGDDGGQRRHAIGLPDTVGWN
jgi:hypothetical protein